MRRSLIRALVQALRLDAPDDTGLCSLSDDDWRVLLDFTDREHMTLALAERCPKSAPAWVRERFTCNLAGNQLKMQRRRDAYNEIARNFQEQGIEWAVLKGLSHDTANRPQGDIDLLCTPDQAAHAQQIVQSLGYEQITKAEEFPTDHLPLLMRRSDWRWRGDYFDPEHPVSVEVHFRLWDPSTECIPVEGLEEFWTRRQVSAINGVTVRALDAQDRVMYAGLHALRHLLRGDLLLWHIYELALMIERTPMNIERYSETLRRAAAIPFRLARMWFGCAAAAADVPLAAPIEQWFSMYAAEPPLAPKCELALHTALLDSRLDRFRIARRKLFPSPNSRLKRKDIRFLANRTTFHVRNFVPALLLWVRFAWGRRRDRINLPREFLQFLGAASLFNMGMTIFFLLYNLQLLKLGFHEDVLGLIAGAMTAGSITGTLPAGFLISRIGLKPALLLAFAAAPVICAVRAVVTDPVLLIASAFLGGLAMSFYAVALTPATAQLVPEESRPRAFSLVCSLGIGIGIAGSSLGGLLPAWLGGLRPTLLAACAIASLSALATLRLPLSKPARRARHSYPRDPVIYRYLAALGLWSLATGALNPFFNVYFATQLKAPLNTIGMIFSASQLTQVVAVLAAPWVLKRFGMPAGVMAMQMVTGVAMALMATMPPLAGAAVLYASYMAFQYMSEPGMFTFLMERAREEERGGAAALNMLVLFAGQAIAATVAGSALHRYGYSVVLIAASLLAIFAGLCFRLALNRETPVLLERSVAL